VKVVFFFRNQGERMSVVAVVGLGYVGLPLAVEFGKKFRTIGYDLSAEKVANYRHPEVILAGRRINDDMGKFIAEQTVKELIRSGHAIKGARVNILGLTFKEDVPGLRNSRVIDVISELKSYGIDVHVHDPVTDARDAMREYGIELVPWDALPRADALIVAVAHKRQGALRRVGAAKSRMLGLETLNPPGQPERKSRGFLGR
jgi:UDP-N-acetyl-D-mannosaminuronate dehydrogenase